MGFVQPERTERIAQQHAIEDLVLDASKWTESEVAVFRGQDGTWWDGNDWVSAKTWLATATNTTDDYHYIDWTNEDLVKGESITFLFRINQDDGTLAEQVWIMGVPDTTEGAEPKDPGV